MALGAVHKVTWKGKEVITQAQRGLTNALELIGEAVEREAKLSMQEGGNKKHPSAPGTPPHAQSGALRDSVEFSLVGDDRVVIGPKVRYGKVHERGGQWGGRNYPARPYMGPALQKVLDRGPGEHLEGLLK